MKYNILYLDPPWNYNNNITHIKQSMYKNRVHFNPSYCGGAKGHYNTMTFDEIQNINIPELADINCALFMWCTFPLLNEQIKLFQYWGFVYKTVAFTWVKTYPKKGGLFFGTGYYTRANAEICLLGIKGKMVPIVHDISSIIISPLQEHSRKPDIIRDKIVELFGDLPRLELFTRKYCTGWEFTGNEPAKFNGLFEDIGGLNESNI